MRASKRVGMLAIVVFAASVTAASAAGSPSDCSTGFTQYDDGTFENGYGAIPEGSPATYVMRVDPPPGIWLIAEICVCWHRLETGSDSLQYHVDVWPVANGGAPDLTTLRSFRSASAAAVPVYPASTFYSTNVGPSRFRVSGPFYVGPRWETDTYPDDFVCADEDGAGGQPAYDGVIGDDPDSDVSSIFDDYKALGIRVRLINVFDIDADGAVGPLTDGLLLLRRAFGFTDDALVGGAVGGGCQRCTAEQITDYLDGEFQPIAGTAPARPAPSADVLKLFKSSAAH